MAPSRSAFAYTGFQRAHSRRPLPIVLPALHERRDECEQVDGHGWCARLQDDFRVDLVVHAGADSPLNRVVLEDGGCHGDEDFGLGDCGRCWGRRELGGVGVDFGGGDRAGGGPGGSVG